MVKKYFLMSNNKIDIIDLTQKKIGHSLTIMGKASLDIKIFFNLQTETINKTWKISDGKLKEYDKKIYQQDYFYSYKINNELWIKFLKKMTNYDNLALGGHLKIFQGKKAYNSLFHRMMRNSHSNHNLNLVAKFYIENKDNIKDFINLNINNEIIKIKKYCPHQKYDLSKANIKNGCILVCPAHKWEFDIRTGKCIKGDPNANIKFSDQDN